MKKTETAYLFLYFTAEWAYKYMLRLKVEKHETWEI